MSSLTVPVELLHDGFHRFAEPLDGRNLWPEFVGSAPEGNGPRLFACERPGELRYGLIEGRFKLVEIVPDPGATRDLLFDVFSDPREEKDLAAERPQLVHDLRQKLEPWKAMPRLPLAPGSLR